MAYGLAPVAALALIGLGSIDSVHVRSYANFGSAHLYDEPADGSVNPRVWIQDRFARTDAESVGVSTVLSSILTLIPFLSHIA